MSTVKQVVDAVYRDWLHAADDQPVVTTPTEELDTTETDVSVDFDMLLPDEQDLFAKGTIVEVDREQMLIRSVSDSTLTVIRGANGTKAAAHGDDALVRPQPRYGRQSVFDAVCDAVPSLWPDLWAVRTQAIDGSLSYIELPPEAYTAVGVHWLEGTTQYTDTGFIIRGHGSSTTGVALFTGLPVGSSGHAVYRGSFPRPQAEGDDLELLGVQREWERIVSVTAAATLIAGSPEIDVLTHEFLAEQAERETLPPGSAGRIAARLFELATQLRQAARRQLIASAPWPVVFTPGSGV